jgi:D-alanine-D-alanine ligase-like ATP-grasp enzyme
VRKLKIAVFFGGKSVEHEVSVVSGIQVCKTLMLEHEVIPVYITKDNEFYHDKNMYNMDFYIDNKFNKKCFLSLNKNAFPDVKIADWTLK